MGRVLGFILDDFADFELTFACHLMAFNGGKEVTTIGYEKTPVRSKGGIIFQPHVTVEEAVDLKDVEALILPGGWSYEQRTELTLLIRNLHGEKKLLGAICAGTKYLAAAGVFEDHSYTTPERVQDPFPQRTFVKRKVVRDGHVITSVANAFVDFAIEMCDWFSLFKNPQEKALVAKYYKGLA